MDLDLRLRLAAFAELRRLREQGGQVVSHQQLEAGFEFEGERIRFKDDRRGIWRPRQLGSDGAALSIVTVAPRPGRQRPYDDQIGSEDSFFVYRYEGNNPNLWTNRALRRAFEEQRPLIYFFGLRPGIYDPVFPCYVQSEDQGDLAFHLSPGTDAVRLDAVFPAETVALQRGYATRAVKVRLHQHRFRELVISAYQEKCTICNLRHRMLLDAAHIVEDRDERGVAEIPNGLSLCRIHHAAYDANILGISPDFMVEIRRDILAEVDGPMLKHGLQEMNGHRIMLPRAPLNRPNPEYLELRYAKFRAA